MLVKICGLKSLVAAEKAVYSGADLLGAILVPNRARTIDYQVAKEISRLARESRKQRNRRFQTLQAIHEHIAQLKPTTVSEYYGTLSALVVENGPFFVGVFRNQPIDQVFEIADELELDFIQLHGSENKLDFISRNNESKYGIIGRYVVPKDVEEMESHLSDFMNHKLVVLALLDSEAGGEGKTIDWDLVSDRLHFGKFILAGGLNPDNLRAAGKVRNIMGFDVSGGVEDESGSKDLAKIQAFVDIGKSI